MRDRQARESVRRSRRNDIDRSLRVELAYAGRPGVGLRDGRRRATVPSGDARRGARRQRVRRLVFAPAYDADGARPALRRKPATRAAARRRARHATPGERDFRRVPGGILAQDRTLDMEDPRRHGGRLRRACRGQTGATPVRSGRCASTSLSTRSSSRATCRPSGSGRAEEQCGRGPARAREGTRPGARLTGAVLASDAFFPFADGPQLASTQEWRQSIQPGGSEAGLRGGRGGRGRRRRHGAHAPPALQALKRFSAVAGYTGMKRPTPSSSERPAEPEALAELYRRHAERLHSWLRAQVAPQIACELTAETFAQAALSLGASRILVGARRRRGSSGSPRTSFDATTSTSASIAGRDGGWGCRSSRTIRTSHASRSATWPSA